MTETLTVLTSVYLSAPERWDYVETTLSSFYRCCTFPGKIVHKLIDDRSPMFSDRLGELCKRHQIEFLGRMPDNRASFTETFRTLLNNTSTEFFLYLEPDHYFYLPADFISPALQLLHMVPPLRQVLLRAPLYYRQFFRSGSELLTWDGTLLFPVPIDQHNTGWVGAGVGHETFSLMPAIHRTKELRDELESIAINVGDIGGGPLELEEFLGARWARNQMVAYLNAQAFCYHIGARGKEGPGQYLAVGDQPYEQVWQRKVAPLNALTPHGAST